MNSTILDTVLAAGRLIVGQAAQPWTRTEKGEREFATSVDVAVGNMLSEAIRHQYADDEIICEDGGAAHAVEAGKAAWYVDPLDGTTNFMHRYPMYAVSLSRYDKTRKQFLTSAVYVPFFDQLFQVENDGPARLWESELQVSTASELNELLVLTGASHKAKPMELDCLKYISSVTAGTRRSGCAAVDLCYVAAGFADAYFHFNLKPWDVAAGVHLVQNAGGMVTNIGSDRFDLANPTILATNRACHARLAAALAEASA